MSSAWRFDPTAITVPVQLWHGEQDGEAPVAMGRWITRTVPTCHGRFFPDEGHLSLIVQHADDILRELVDAASVPSPHG